MTPKCRWNMTSECRWNNQISDVFALAAPASPDTLTGRATRPDGRVIDVVYARDGADGTIPEWVVGTWHQTNDGKDLPVYRLYFNAEGTVRWVNPEEVGELGGTWDIQHEQLRMDFQNGCFYRFDLSDSRPATDLSGMLMNAVYKRPPERRDMKLIAGIPFFIPSAPAPPEGRG